MSVFVSFLLDATLGTTTMPLVKVKALGWLTTPAAVVTDSAYGPPGECAGTVAVKLVPLGDTDWICSGTPPTEAVTLDGKFVPSTVMSVPPVAAPAAGDTLVTVAGAEIV